MKGEEPSRDASSADPSSTDPSSSVVDAALRALAHTGTDTRAALLPGTRLGRYEILRFLARGGFGAVYEARDTELGRHVAVKVLEASIEADPGGKMAQVFKQEAATVARLSHVNLVTLHDFGFALGRPYLVLELLRGQTLAGHLVSRPLSLRDALDVAAEVARGLAHAHAHGVVHRDLKPSNVFLCDSGQVKILDFGLARVAQDELGKGPLGEGLARAGTRGYMSPEQERGDAQDARSDLYSVGVVLREMLLGLSAAANAERELPLAVRALLERLLAREPADRLSSADELVARLASVRRALWDTELQGGQEPFRYLEHFTEEDAPWFFGRQEEVVLTVERLGARAVVAVAGASGAGKSSLVRAGVVPRMRGRTSCVVVLRPGPDPFERLVAALARAGVGITDDRARAALRGQGGALGETLREHAARLSSGVLLVVDQAEELFTQVTDPETRRAFALSLTAAADDDEGPVRLLLTVRDDFLGRLAALPGMAGPIGMGTLFLGAPDARAMVEALRAPAQRAGFELDPGLCESIVDTLDGETAPLPLLQLAASRLWEQRDLAGHRLSRAALDARGGVSGVIAAHAEDVYRRLLSGEDAALARSYLCALVTPEGTRRAALRADLESRAASPEAATRVLETLVSGRILTSSREERGERIELAHEALIGQWDRLRQWLDDDRDGRRLEERIEQAATLWVERGRPADLLWRGHTLHEVVAQAPALRAHVHPAAGEFVDACVATWQRARRRRRVGMATAIAVVLVVMIALWLGLQASRRSAEEARVGAVLSSAAAARDPLVGALLLRELGGAEVPTGGAALAFRIAQAPIPSAVLRGHKGLVSSAVFSPDGRLIASGSYDGLVKLWRADGSGEPESRRVGDEVMMVRMSPDGRRLAAASRVRHVPLWRIDAEGHLSDERVLRGHTGFVLAVAFSPDGRLLATGSADATVRVWPLRGGEPRVIAHQRPVWSVAFSPDGRLVASGSEDRSVRLSRVTDGSAVFVDRGHEGAVRAVAFSASGARLASAADDGSVRVFSTNGGGDPLVLRGHGARLLGVAFNPAGTRVVTASMDQTARVFPLEVGGRPRVLRGHDDQLVSATFDGTGERILTASNDGTARLWPLRSNAAPLVLRGHRQGLGGAAFSKDGGRIVTFSEDHTLRVWDGEHRGDLVRGPDGVSMMLAFSPDGRLFAEGMVSGEVRVWPGDGRGKPRLLVGHEGRPHCLTFDALGKRLLSTSFDRTARIWDLAGGRPPIVLRGHEGSIEIARFSPDERLVATSGHDGAMRLFHADSGEVAHVFRQPSGMFSVSFSPDGAFIATGSAEGGVVNLHLLRDLKAPPLQLRAHEGRVDVEFARDGRHLLTFGTDGLVKLWRTGDWSAPPIVLRGHTGPVGVARMSPRGDRVASGSADMTARIWSTDPSSDPIVLRGHSGRVRGLRWSADGSRLVTVAEDGTVRVWNTTTGKETQRVDLGGLLDNLALSPGGRRAAVRTDWGVRHIVTLPEWPELMDRLRTKTRLCLTPEEREEHLREPPATARAAAKRCAVAAAKGSAK